MARISGLDGREHVLEVASRLFYAHGVGDVSVDQVAQAAGLTKRAVYYHFPHKRDLVLAYLERSDDPALTLLQGLASRRGDSEDHPFQRILTGIERWIGSGAFNGCAFLNAARAMPDDRSVAVIALAHKRRTRDWLSAVATDQNHSDPDAVAGQFLIVLDSVLTTGHLYPAADVVGRARTALDAILMTPAAGPVFTPGDQP